MLSGEISFGLFDALSKIELYDTDANDKTIPIKGIVYIRSPTEGLQSTLAADRLKLFTRIGRKTAFTIQFSGASSEKVRVTSDETGFFETECRVDKPYPSVEIQIAGAKANARLVPQTGLSIVSDIDDTIKVTDVANPANMVINTFAEEYKATPQVPELFKRFEVLGELYGQASFHYVSGSPSQLYKPLKEFIASKYPDGSVCLKNVNIHSIASVVAFISNGMFLYKLNTINALMQRFPERTYILVGDNGQQDPEVYNELYKTHSAKISKIYIRLYKPDDLDERLKAVPRESVVRIARE